MIETFTFFYGGPFSQWYPVNFKVDGIEYNCAEQYMMAQKALTFGDNLAHEQIMNSANPAEQKSIGRLVKGYNDARWHQDAKLVVYRGNAAKFLADVALWSALSRTYGTTLVEASLTDQIWGIGLAEGDPRSFSRDTWQGTNWLGKILTMVRNDLMET